MRYFKWNYGNWHNSVNTCLHSHWIYMEIALNHFSNLLSTVYTQAYILWWQMKEYQTFILPFGNVYFQIDSVNFHHQNDFAICLVLPFRNKVIKICEQVWITRMEGYECVRIVMILEGLNCVCFSWRSIFFKIIEHKENQHVNKSLSLCINGWALHENLWSIGSIEL